METTRPYGRRFFVVVEVTYIGGTLADDAWEALSSAIRRSVGDDVLGLSLVRSTHRQTDVILEVQVRSANPLEAITQLSGAVDQSLMSVGHFEEFDVSGKVLRIAPAERAERIYVRPGSGLDRPSGTSDSR